MHAIPAMIPAGTERQAMDWSLVLVSQGIEALVERDPESGVWRLVVEGPDYQRALGAIRQYHAENRQRRWQQTLPWTGLVFDWRCMVPILIFIVLFVLEAAGRAEFSRLGMMNNTLVHQGQWWRLFTAVTLHGDLAHLAANVTTGLILIGLAMGVYGAGLGLLVSFLAGVGGNLAGLWLHTAAHRGLGASGMIMGALGLLAAQWLVLLKHGLTARQLAVRGIVSGGFLLILLGFSPQENVDVLAHVAGFVTGLVLGGALAFLPTNWRSNAWLDRVALLLFFGGGSVAWWFALRG